MSASPRFKLNVFHTGPTDAPHSDNRLSTENLAASLQGLSKSKLINRIPKGARNSFSRALSGLLKNTCLSNNASDWQKLFLFPRISLYAHDVKSGSRPSLKRQLRSFESTPITSRFNLTLSTAPTDKQPINLKRADNAKFSKFDIKGTICLLSSLSPLAA